MLFLPKVFHIKGRLCIPVVIYMFCPQVQPINIDMRYRGKYLQENDAFLNGQEQDVMGEKAKQKNTSAASYGVKDCYSRSIIVPKEKVRILLSGWYNRGEKMKI